MGEPDEPLDSAAGDEPSAQVRLELLIPAVALILVTLWIARDLPLSAAILLMTFNLLLAVPLIIAAVFFKRSAPSAPAPAGIAISAPHRPRLIPSRLALAGSTAIVMVIASPWGIVEVLQVANPDLAGAISAAMTIVGLLITCVAFALPERIASPGSKRERYQSLEALVFYALHALIIGVLVVGTVYEKPRPLATYLLAFGALVALWAMELTRSPISPAEQAFPAGGAPQ
ncbi:MAG: hypothetical protein FDZ70_09260 [Actinobacteria bacterium]|nr:MAG: hypothetical protein FDZ70_09260 [Actinomycetota bacterium]